MSRSRSHGDCVERRISNPLRIFSEWVFIIPYIPSLSQRGIHTEIHLGTAETNHRFYSYRMKRQGRSWSSEGMEYMVW
ncbi:MAG: UPF0236 family protein, partial [Dialister sp.]|nr:UPF0236 family protein [Dialister sp.]